MTKNEDLRNEILHALKFGVLQNKVEIAVPSSTPSKLHSRTAKSRRQKVVIPPKAKEVTVVPNEATKVNTEIAIPAEIDGQQNDSKFLKAVDTPYQHGEGQSTDTKNAWLTLPGQLQKEAMQRAQITLVAKRQ